MVVCPSCKSSRVRNDYKPAPLVLRLIGIRALLCDYCNFQFRAFCPRPPRAGKPKAAKPRVEPAQPASNVDLAKLREKIATEQQEKAEGLKRIQLTLRPSVKSETVTGQLLKPGQPDLRTQVLKLHAQGAKDFAAATPAPAPPIEELAAPGMQPPCPQCASRNVRRRQRTSLERAALSLTDYRAFQCRDCSASFYAKLEKDDFKIKLPDAGLFDSSAWNAEQKG